MFKVGSFEEELATSMERSLVSNRLENKYSFDKIAKVADYLSAAAELLDDTGYTVESEMVTRILAKIAGDDNDASATMFETPEGFRSLEDMKPKHKKSPTLFETPYGFKSMEEMKEESGDSVIIDPLIEEELAVKPKHKGEIPLVVDNKGNIEEDPEAKFFGNDEYLQFQSIANKLAAKLHKKKV